MRRVLVVIGAVFGVSTGSAVAGEVYQMGPGAGTCGLYAQQYQADPANTESFYFTWAQGFISGMNTLSLSAGGPIVDMDATPIEAQRSRIRAYCNAHPLSDYDAAVFDLYASLAKVTPAHKPNGI
jgi:hypothetical protein